MLIKIVKIIFENIIKIFIIKIYNIKNKTWDMCIVLALAVTKTQDRRSRRKPFNSTRIKNTRKNMSIYFVFNYKT